MTGYPERLQASWLWEELKRVRNIKPAFHWGLIPALAYSALDTVLLRGRAPWTIHHRPDHTTLRKASECAPIPYPKPDGVLTFDKLSSVFLSNTNHEENQPSHLKLKDPSIPIRINLPEYAGPEQRYCPAGVYEFVAKETRSGCKSTRRTACTARPVTSRTRPRTSSGPCPRAAAGPIIPTCEGADGITVAGLTGTVH